MPTSGVVSVAVEIANSVKLFKFNTKETLDNIIRVLCEESDVDYVKDKFAFQLFIRDQSNKKIGTKFVTEENRESIIDGTELKLVYSPTETARRIFDNLQENRDIPWALEKLALQINDPVFVSKVFDSCYPKIMALVNDEKLPPELFCYCLRAILGFLKYDWIAGLEPSLIKKLIKNIDCTARLDNGVVENSLRLLEQSVAKNQYSYIANGIELDDLLPLFWDRDSSMIQECALTLMNNIAFYCTCEDMKARRLKEMNSCKFLSNISSNILYQGNEPSSEMAKQLYIYQTLILSLLLDRLDPFILDCQKLPDFELVSESKRYSNFESSASESNAEFNNDSTGSSSRNSKEMSGSTNVDRIRNSWKSEGMYPKRSNLVLSFLNLELCELNKEMKYLEEMPSLKPTNQLVHDCVMYFSKHYRKNYQASLCTEGCQNFITICSDVVNLIIYDLLHVGEHPVKGSTLYCPLIFSSSKKQPFIEEFFCVAMWLFERTRREMRSVTYEDYKKVIKVMERQLHEGLLAQPKTYDELEMILRNFTYSCVSEQWDIERKAKQQQLYNSSPSVKELRLKLKEQAIELIKTQRIKYIIKGSKFLVWNPQRNQKGKNKFWFARLSNNKKCIKYSEDHEEATDEMKEMKSLPLRDVEDFVVGKKCPHLKDFKCPKDKKEMPLAFSLIIEKNAQTSLDFVTNSRNDYDLWVDALNTLFGNKMKSNLFKSELNTLLDMELEIQLLDIEGIDFPVEPPPIPPLPDNYDFNDDYL